MPARLNNVEAPCYVLDFTEDTGYFVHKVETGKRAEVLARLLRKVFAGNRPLPKPNEQKEVFAYTAYESLEKINEGVANIPVFEFGGVIPSWDRAVNKVREANRNLQESDLQDRVFLQMKNFFARITPIPAPAVEAATAEETAPATEVVEIIQTKAAVRKRKKKVVAEDMD